ncbi:hypothetical protein [Rhizobium binxianense]
MPRNPGTGVYTLPAGTGGEPNTPISSAMFNTFVNDIAQDLNTARPISSGGTNATNATQARANLGLAIGTNVQAYDAGLASIAGLTTAANQMLYTTAADAYATTALTPFARTILDDADAATVRATLGLTIGTSGATVPLLNGANTWSGVQTITAPAGLVLSSNNPRINFTETDTGADTDITANSGEGSLFVYIDKNSEGSNPVFGLQIQNVTKMTLGTASGSFAVPITVSGAAVDVNGIVPLTLANSRGGGGDIWNARCLIPDFDGAIFSQAWRDSLWGRFYTAAPRRRRQSVEQYKIVKRA